MTYFSRRMPHLLTHADLAVLLTPTYAEAVGVDEDEALERLQLAVTRPGVIDDLYSCVSAALTAVQGDRTEDALMDKLSKGVQRRLGKMKAAETTMALSTVMVRINVEIGQAPEQLKATLETDKGKALLATGLKEVGAFLVKSLVK